MLYVEKELNSIIFDEEDFEPKRNYMPDLVLAFRDMDQKRTIHFVVNLKNTPLLFILYFRKLMQTNPNLDLELYFKDKSEILPKTLESYKLKYKPLSEYPSELPNSDNVSETIDPYKSVEGIDNPVLIESIRMKAKEDAEAAADKQRQE